MAAQGFQAHEDVVLEAVRAASDGAVDDGMTAVCASRASFAREHPEVLRAWRRSLQEAIDHLNANEAEVRALLQPWLKNAAGGGAQRSAADLGTRYRPAGPVSR
jgi:ABC-type nitrate/sulfonate/bicarbonate transport system substrate-binding protein